MKPRKLSHLQHADLDGFRRGKGQRPTCFDTTRRGLVDRGFVRRRAGRDALTDKGWAYVSGFDEARRSA